MSDALQNYYDQLRYYSGVQAEKDLARQQSSASQGQILNILGDIVGRKGYEYFSKPGATSGLLASLGLGGSSAAPAVGPLIAKDPVATALTNTGFSGYPTSGAIEQLAANGAVPEAPAAAGMDLATMGTYAAPVAGVLGMRDLFTHNRGKGRGAIQGAASGAAMGAPFGTPGMAIGAILGGAAGIFGPHKSIKQQQQDRWDELLNNGVAGVSEAQKAQEALPEYMRGKMASGENKGKDWNWKDAVTEARKDPGQFHGVYGNYEVFGSDWSKLDKKTKDTVVTKLIDENLYDPHAGDIRITDPARALEILSETTKGTTKPPSKAMISYLSTKVPAGKTSFYLK